MRILFLTQWFDPEPTPKGLIFVKKLKELGNDVDVLSPIPNYPKGKYYDGYKFKLFQSEYLDGTKVIRAPIFPSHDESSMKRALTYLSFTLSSLFIGIFLRKKYDLIYAYHPPNIGLVALLISFFKKIPVVHDVQDIWPDTFYSTGMIRNKIIIKMLNSFSSWVYKSVDALVVISPGFKKALVQKGIPKEKINIIYNWCEESKILMPEVIKNNPIKKNKRFNIIFAGNMGKAQNLIFVLKSAKILSVEAPDIHFNFLGDGLELNKMKDYSIKHNLKNVSFIPRVSMDAVGSVLSEADVLLVHLKQDPLFEITIPSKIQAYLAIGKPIINTVRGDASDIISNSNAGINVHSENPSDLAMAFKKLHQMEPMSLCQFGTNGKSYYHKNFSLLIGVKKLEEVFNFLTLEPRN